MLSFFLAGCSIHGFYYYPNRKLYTDPANLGMPYEMVTYPSRNGKKLYAILFEAKEKPAGIVVHFHGNFGNVSNHFLESQFLTRYGFDVLVFDYQGYGASEGRPTPKRTVEDGIATVRLAQSRNRNPAGGVVLFGQSLGGAVAAVVAAKEPSVKGAVIESAFNSYRAIARDVIKRSVFTWPLYPIYPLLVSRAYDPEDYVGKISPRPILFIHGDQDTIVPVWTSRKLFEKASEPKRLWIIEGANHLGCRRAGGKKYETTLAAFFKEALSPINNKGAAK